MGGEVRVREEDQSMLPTVFCVAHTHHFYSSGCVPISNFLPFESGLGWGWSPSSFYLLVSEGFIYVYVCMCTYVRVLMEARHGCQAPWRWNYSCLCAGT